ncbi:MAG: hypothetical protein KAT25_04390 [Sulfuriflexus sp.]|nr:hypothetical protein [Sulfuriflexus sp.]
MGTDDIDDFPNRLEKILDVEQEELNSSKRQHHTDWDNHIITLSTASLGFTFAFLPIGSGTCFIVAAIGVVSFILSICFATANFIVADRGFDVAFESLILRRKHALKIKSCFSELKTSLIDAEARGDNTAYDAAKTQCSAQLDTIGEETDLDADLKKQNKINNNVSLLNKAKTYSFITGTILVVVFTFINIDFLGK